VATATRSDTPPTYRHDKVEPALLKAAAELHPTRLPARELIPKVVGNSDDARQVRAAFDALGRLREFGVIADREDGVVQLTPSALRAVALLARCRGADDDRPGQRQRRRGWMMARKSNRQVAKRFGENLKRARRAAGLSQEALAVRASLHRTEIGLVERGERMPGIDTATMVAVAVGVPIEQLCAGIVWVPAPDVQEGHFE
jgi:DNA-binding XRE family transcriptional regulator